MLENEAIQPEPVSPEQDSLSAKLSREVDLFRGLSTKALMHGLQEMEHEPERVVTMLAIGAATGGALAAMTRNPGLLGRALVPYVQGAVRLAPKAMGGLLALDVGVRVGVPAHATWVNKEHHAAAKNMLACNIGEGLVDMGAGALGGVAGARVAWKFTRPWQNKVPEFDPFPSQTIGEKPRSIENPSQYSTMREGKVKDDVVALYEKSFPVEERQPLDEIRELVDAGKIQVHSTRDNAGKLHSFSFTSMHDETGFKFANLDFIATETGIQSRGAGSLHAVRLNELVKAERPDLLGMTLEMESPAELGIGADQLAIRLRRARFYDRLDAPDTNVKFDILDFNDPSYRGPAQWRAWIYNREKFDPLQAARLLYTDEAGYGQLANSRAVRGFDRANNYWLPEYGWGGAAAIASPAGHVQLTARRAWRDLH